MNNNAYRSLVWSRAILGVMALESLSWSAISRPSSHLWPCPVIHHARRSLILVPYRNYNIKYIKQQPPIFYVTLRYYLMWIGYIRISI